MNRAEPELLASLLERHGPALALYARQWCDCADDVVQEALWQLARQEILPDNVLAWLYRVVRNRAISAARSRARRNKYESDAARQTEVWFTPAADDAIDAQAATSALQELCLEERESVVAHLWGGLTFAQIGDLAGVSASTAHRRYEAALVVLRRKLKASCPNQKTSRRTK